MRLLVLFLPLLLLMMPVPARADSEARHGANSVRITPLACTDAKVIAFLTAAGENPADYHAARAEVGGNTFAGCWKPDYDRRVVLLRYEDGDAGAVQFGELKPTRDS